VNLFASPRRLRWSFELDRYQARVETSEFRSQWAEWNVRERAWGAEHRETETKALAGTKWGPEGDAEHPLPTPEFRRLVEELQARNGCWGDLLPDPRGPYPHDMPASWLGRAK
jgi:hypothetical protein